jgi:hypothetical protein
MTRIRFTGDFPGSIETSHKAYKAKEEADVSDFAAGQLVGSGKAERVDDSTDPASPLNLAGPDGRPLAQARIPANPAEAGKTEDVTGGVVIEEAQEPVEPEDDPGTAPDAAKNPGHRGATKTAAKKTGKGR